MADDKRTDHVLRAEAAALNLGATGQFPHGRLGPHDQGELRAGLRLDGGRIILAFGKPVSWVAMTPAMARDLAKVLTERADELEPR